jgi:hypothetical protein
VHNGPAVRSIVEGGVLLQVEGQDEAVLRPGDVLFEPAGVPITHFDALGEELTFLAYFLLGPGQQPEIVLSETCGLGQPGESPARNSAFGDDVVGR